MPKHLAYFSQISKYRDAPGFPGINGIFLTTNKPPNIFIAYLTEAIRYVTCA
jgi:hypothetical protein